MSRLALQLGVLLTGGLFVALGAVLVVLPGPLTIPPVLLGVWIWATEFVWADRLLQRARRAAGTAWAAARRRPVATAALTLGGLVAAAGAVVVVRRLDLLDRLGVALG